MPAAFESNQTNRVELCYTAPVKRVIHWFRRDLRVSDNTALSEAARRAEQVIPFFVLQNQLHRGTDAPPPRQRFLLQSLAELRNDLAELGYPLVFRTGDPADVLVQLSREVGAEAVFANKRYEPHAEAQDGRVFNALNAAGIGFESFKDAVIWEEQEILTQAGKPFTVYTPYSKAWKTRKIPEPSPKLRPVRSWELEVRSDPLPLDTESLGKESSQWTVTAGERAALERLRCFMAGPVYDYATHRDLPAVEGTSQLSPHLRCGTIGIRTILAALTTARKAAMTSAQRQSCEVFLNELIWREFYLQILHNFPHVTKGAFRPEYDKLAWEDNREHFQAWCAGLTGYPIVDAAMRCLNVTGNLHNRLRMIVAMFLTKDLLLHWQWGEHYFMQQLVDGDLAANNGGWQWSAGTGTDAAPYFRIFNPVSQGEKFDPRGEFVRRWVPELADLPDNLIHQPWQSPLASARGKYPPRLVRHEDQRSKCLALYQAAKQLA